LQSPKFPAASRLIRTRNLRLCASIRQVRQPIVEDVFSGAADVVTNLDYVLNV
jgi:hypothetical protein